jgi:hypothetical protein
MKRLILIAILLFSGTGIVFAQERKPSDDAKLILSWLLGQDVPCLKKFADVGFLTKAEDLVLYTDVVGVEIPKGVRQVPYEFIQARIETVRTGEKTSPAIVITSSVEDAPKEGALARGEKLVRIKMQNEKFYFVEVAIGNMAHHWIKLVVGEKDGKPTIMILGHAMS